MKKIKIFSGFLLLALIMSCSTRKNTFINRNFHAVTTEFNVLFNGQQAYLKGIEQINTEYKDDFWEILPIEPIKFEREQLIQNTNLGAGFGQPALKDKDENNSTTPFDRAEEKATKAIQKHSMNIYGKEKNPQIDDAYLLLGKSRYYTQRFVPAIEAFNYIIANYPKADLVNETRIWRAKSNIRIDNPEFAIETLNILLRQADVPDEKREQANTAMAMAYMKMDSLHLVKKYLRRSVRTRENKNQAARNLFILGQIYHSENKKDTATMVFKELIKFKKAPYKYRIHANLELAKNVVSDSASFAVQKQLEKLIKNRDNRPYLDKLYFRVGVLEEERDSINNAVANYKKSLRALNGSDKQKTYTYEKLATINFKNLEYVTAASYYDSVLLVAKDKENLRIKRIERKVKNLASLIKYENILQKNDSILSLVSMTDKQRNNYFQAFIDSIKKQDELLAQQKLNKISFGTSFGGGGGKSNNKGKWYFYNPQSIGFGKGEFQRVWGNRPLEDNWRWSDNTKANASIQDSVTISQKIKKYDLDTYLSQIPTKKREIDSLKNERNQALFELGLIYKEQFKNKERAIGDLERLLNSDPKERLILPTNYHLYILYKEDNNPKATQYKEVVLNDYPESPFARVIEFPEEEFSSEKQVDEIADLYKIAYNIYKDNSFAETVCFVEMSLPTIDNSVLISKFELLRAYAIGKYQSREKYKNALQKIAVKYADTEEGKRALEILNQLTN